MIKIPAPTAAGALRLLGGAAVALLASFDGYETWHALDLGYGAAFHPLVLAGDAVVIAALCLRGRDPRRAALVAAATSLAVTAVVASLAAMTGRFPWTFGAAEGGCLLALLVAVVRHTRRVLPTAAALAAAVAALMVRSGVLHSHGSWRAVADDAPPVLVAVLVAVLLGGYLRSMDTERVAAEIAVRQSERLDLAYELHDLVAHQLTGIVLRAQAARFAGAGAAAAAEALADIEHTGADALGSIRRLARHLRGMPGAAPPGPTSLTDVADLAAGFGTDQAQVTLDISADLQGDPPRPEVVSSVHRVVRESLTNVRRHAADARRIEIRIDRNDEEVSVTVHDDGQGRAPRFTAGTGTGLLGLSERLTAMGGRLTAGPDPDGGWQVCAAVPESPGAP